MNASSVKPVALPVPVKKLYAYDANNNMIYEGWAPLGTSKTEAKWAIKRTDYDANNNMLMETMATVLGDTVSGTRDVQWVFVWDLKETYNYA